MANCEQIVTIIVRGPNGEPREGIKIAFRTSSGFTKPNFTNKNGTVQFTITPGTQVQGLVVSNGDLRYRYKNRAPRLPLPLPDKVEIDLVY